MKEELFIRNNSNTWRELEDLSNIINKKGLKALPSAQVKRFLHIFRQCSHHLAYARTHFPQSNTVNYLNSLVGKCHSHVYAVKKVPFKTFIKYICIDFPSLLRQYKWFITASFGFFIFGAILAMLLVFSNSDNAKYFLDPVWVEGIKDGQQGGGQWNYPLMSSYIMVNNIRVSLLAFVLGLTLGLGTIYVLFINGALLGALTALIYMYGNPTHYWSLILPHGVIELTAIFISGAAGLMLAKGILLPGELTRWHSLIKGAKNAVLLLLGVVILLVIAGIIEGFYTPLDISEISKLVFAGLTGLGLTVYFAVPYILKNKKPKNI